MKVKEKFKKVIFTKDLFPRLIKIVLFASFIDSLLHVISIWASDLDKYKDLLPNLFIDSFLGTFLFYFFFWIPLALIIEMLIGHYLGHKYNIRSLLMYCLIGILAVFLVYLVPYMLNNEFYLLLETCIILGTISAIIFYHTKLYFVSFFNKKDKNELKKIGYSFLFFIVIILIFLTFYNKNFEIIINEETEQEFNNIGIEQELRLNEETKNIEEIVTEAPFNLKIPTYLPNGIKFGSGINLHNIEGDVVRISYLNNNSDELITFHASDYFLKNEFDYQKSIFINQSKGIIGYIVNVDNGSNVEKTWTLNWKEDGIYYSITSSVLSEKELMKVAESLKFYKD